jgi:hypothetical protein
MSAVAPDWLSVLKSAISNGEPIEVHGDELRIGDTSVPLSTNTFYKSQKGTGPYYTVGQVWHFYRLRELVHAKYVTEIGSGAVSYVDRKDLLAFVLGEVSSSKCIKPYTTTTTTTTTTSAIADVGPSGVESSSSTAQPAQVDENDDVPLANVAASDAIAAVPLPTHSPSAKSVRFAESVTAVAHDGAVAAESVAPIDKPSTANMVAQKRSARDSSAAAAAASHKPAKRTRAAAEPSVLEIDVAPQEPMDPAELEELKLTRAIENTERRLRNRKSVLQTQVKKHGQPFFASMLSTTKRLQKLDAMRRQLAEREQQNERMRQRPTAYDRYNVREDQFWQERISDAQELGIDTAGTFAGGLADDVNAGGAAASAAKAAEARAASQRREQEKARAADKELKAKAELQHVPIIIVPDAVGPLTIVNARKFFESGVYEPPIKPDAPVPPVQRFQRGDATIEVRSSTAATRLKDDEWRERVCCVVAQGTVWQFRGWLFSEPVSLFSTVRGVVFRFDDEKANATVLSWSVMQAVLSRSKPHLNKTCFMKFWQEIDRWAQRRPKLKLK